MKLNIKSEQNKSSITDHVNQENHVINWNEAKIISHESDKTTRWIRETVKIRQESQGVMNRATSTTICCSLWRPLAENSKQQFEEDSSCCRNVTENLVSY